MRKLLLIALLLSSPAWGAVTYVNSVGAYTNATACNGGSQVITPTAGDDLVAIIETFTSSSTFSSVTSTVGATITTDLAYPGGSGVKYAVYRVHGASAVSQGITVNFAATTECFEWLYDITPAAFDQVTSIATGSSASFLTNSLTPAQNGALLIAVAGITGSTDTMSAWTNSFTVNPHSRTSGPNAYSAYLAQATAASVASGATISGSTPWAGLLIDYTTPPAAFKPGIVISNGHALMSGSPSKPVVVN